MPDTIRSFAPGRVEILGNHTDYNEGFVLAAAIHLGVTVEAKRLSTPNLEIRSSTVGRHCEFDVANIVPSPTEEWANYPAGVIKMLREDHGSIQGMAIAVSSDLPQGAGLSSSAAIEVATGLAAAAIYDLDLGPMTLAKLCQKAENEFVGVQCGLLDQITSVFGVDHQIVSIDFRSLEVGALPLPAQISLLIVDSGVPHSLTGGEYNERRTQCRMAADALGVRALRDANLKSLEATPMDPIVRRRARHIIGENERVLAAESALRNSNLAEFGELMWQSHESSRHNFENSTPYLDALVTIARQIDGVIGARLTGGGFGGSIICLVEQGRADDIIREIQHEYQEQTGAKCSANLTSCSQGARLLK